MLIHRIFFPVTVLGPGGERLGIWTQGCSIHCTGCMTLESWKFDSKYFLDFNSIEIKILEAKNIGVTSAVISGGEPFDQPEGLLFLLLLLKTHDFSDILVYSGYFFDNILKRYPNHLNFIDLLISEPFIYSESNTKIWRGSDNQEIHILNKKINYDESILNSTKFPPNREIQIIEDNASMHNIYDRNS